MTKINKNILHFISSGGLYGAESIVLSLGQHFNTHQTKTIIGALKDNRNPQLEIIEKGQDLNIPTLIIESKGRFDIKPIFILSQFIKRNHIHVLHTHNYKSNFIGLIAAKMSHIPVIATAHGFTDMDRKVTLYEKLDRWILKLFFDKVIVVTKKILPNISSKKRIIIQNGLDINKFSFSNEEREQYIEYFRKKWNIQKKDILIGTVGRLSKEKNQQLLINAVKRLIDKNLPIKLIIIGGGSEEKRLKDFCHTNNLSKHVIFTGIIKQIVPIYQALDIFVLTSITEGIPLSIIEAMAAKVCVIATKVGGIPELIQNNKTGILVPSENVSKLVVALEHLIPNTQLQNQLIENAYQFINQNFSMKKMLHQYQKVYDKVTMELD